MTQVGDGGKGRIVWQGQAWYHVFAMDGQLLQALQSCGPSIAMRQASASPPSTVAESWPESSFLLEDLVLPALCLSLRLHTNSALLVSGHYANLGSPSDNELRTLHVP